MDTLKVAIVGTGHVAEASYLPCLAREPNVDLAYYNRTSARAVACAERFGGQAFGSLAELAAWGADTVFILTREMERYDAAMAVLAHNPPRLFFEKPLCARRGQENVDEQDFVEGRGLLHEAARRGCETAMIFNYRFYEHTLLARRIAAERDFGAVSNIAAVAHYACWSHTIDLIHHFAGPIAEVSARAGATVRGAAELGLHAPDLAAAFITEAGATGTLLGTAGVPWESALYELSVNYERGRIRMQDLDGDLEVMDARRGSQERYSILRGRSRWDQYHASFGKSIRAYLASIRERAAPPVPGLAGLLELQVEAGLRRSADAGRPVRLAEELPLAEA
ncbi:MAG: Oxidoreductase family, NAD-binding Rossmann fold [Chloroflexi bacterium ADurb.Bin325]|nr:MAG: Oxidoreductase family, NAD-binding Rossmann fold [Chloroflexi bacterium ADurb.Bin325]